MCGTAMGREARRKAASVDGRAGPDGEHVRRQPLSDRTPLRTEMCIQESGRRRAAQPRGGRPDVRPRQSTAERDPMASTCVACRSPVTCSRNTVAVAALYSPMILATA